MCVGGRTDMLLVEGQMGHGKIMDGNWKNNSEKLQRDNCSFTL